MAEPAALADTDDENLNQAIASRLKEIRNHNDVVRKRMLAGEDAE
ncbi:hypothetical protein ACFP72_17450 [Pseudomonas spelaei]|nr:hypothetical protein [Pseudomonas spelaei]